LIPEVVMNRLALILPVLACVASVPLTAQWLNHPTPALPRTADGKPNLSAPAPRAPDGKPDLSGLWNRMSPKYSRNIAADLKPGEVLPWAEALVSERRATALPKPRSSGWLSATVVSAL